MTEKNEIIEPTVEEEMLEDPRYDQSVPPWMHDGAEAEAYEAYQDYLESAAQEFILKKEHDEIMAARKSEKNEKK
jgi:hypothetical protein